MKSNAILVLTQWGFKEGLIQSYTLPYLKMISEADPDLTIYLITHEKKESNKLNLRSTVPEHDLTKSNILLLQEKYYPIGIIKFFIAGIHFIEYACLIFKHKFKFIHCFCTPAGSYGYLLSKFTRTPLIVDSYEPHSEYMKDAGVWNSNGYPYKILTFFEKRQAKHSRYLIVTTSSVIEFTEKRFSIKFKKSYVKPACVDLEKFTFLDGAAQQKKIELGIENKIVGVYAGKFGDFYLKEEVFELLQARAITATSPARTW